MQHFIEKRPVLLVKMAFEKNSKVSIMHMGNTVGDGVVKRKGPNAQLQGFKLPKGCYGIHVVLVTAKEPIPLFHVSPKDESIVTLQQAIGSIVAWPFNGVVRPRHNYSYCK